MRKRARWMNIATDPILETLRSADELFLSRGDVNYNIQRKPGDQPAKQTVYRAFEKLEEYGFVDVEGDGTPRYRINDRGVAYLESELDASSVEPVNN